MGETQINNFMEKEESFIKVKDCRHVKKIGLNN